MINLFGKGHFTNIAPTAVDVLARRMRLSFLNMHAAFGAPPRVVNILADELGCFCAERTAVDFFSPVGLALEAVTKMLEPVPRCGRKKPGNLIEALYSTMQRPMSSN